MDIIITTITAKILVKTENKKSKTGLGRVVFMVDIHSHILPSIDDGAQSPEASLLMAQIAENEKIKHIIATPHYIPGEIEYKKEDVDYRVALLQSKLTQEGLDIKIHTGSEIYLDAAVPA